jgi:hypothetical protein
MTPARIGELILDALTESFFAFGESLNEALPFKSKNMLYFCTIKEK